MKKKAILSLVLLFAHVCAAHAQVTISNLPAASGAGGSDVTVLVQSNMTKKISINNLFNNRILGGVTTFGSYGTWGVNPTSPPSDTLTTGWRLVTFDAGTAGARYGLGIDSGVQWLMGVAHKVYVGNSTTPTLALTIASSAEATFNSTVDATGFKVSGAGLAASHLSNGVTGTGAVVLNSGPTLTGTVTVDNSGTLRLPNEGLYIRDPSGAHHLKIKPGSTLAADRLLTIMTSDTDRTVTLGGDFFIGHTVQFLTSNTTVLTLPTGGTVATLGGAEVLSNKSIPKLTNLTANGFVKTSGGDGTLSVDTNTYLTTNQTITLSGNVTGSGTTSITTTIANNAVSDAKLRQGVARSVIGVTGNATANVADIQGSTDQILRVNGAGTALAFGSIDLSKSAAVGTSVLSEVNGGTGDAGTAWSSYTPTVIAGSGSFTSVAATGKYKKIGKTVFVRIRVTITTNGTAASYVGASLPVAAKDQSHSMAGRENGITGKSLVGTFFPDTSTLLIRFYDDTYPGANGHILDITGVYEAN